MVTVASVKFDGHATPYWYYVSPAVDLSVGDRINFMDNKKMFRGPATVVALQSTNDVDILPHPPHKLIMSAEKIGKVKLETSTSPDRICGSIDHIIFNGPATIIFFGDGKKEISKISEEDMKVADPRVGFCITYLKHILPEVVWKKEILPIMDILTDLLSDGLIDPTDMSICISQKKR